MKFRISDEVTKKEIYFKLYEITNGDGLCLVTADKKGLPIDNILEISPDGIRLYFGLNKNTGLPLDDQGRIKIIPLKDPPSSNDQVIFDNCQKILRYTKLPPIENQDI